MNKNIIKFFLVFVFVILASGCSVQYTLSLNEDSSINETIVATEMTKRLESRTKLKGNQAINYVANMFTTDISRYSMSTKEEGTNTIVTSSAAYDDLNDFTSKFNSDIFDKHVITKDGDNVTITIDQKVKLGGDSPSTPIYDNIDVIIKLPFEVTDSNATEVSKKEYKWSFKKEEELKSIKLTYKEDKIKDKVNVTINDKKYNFEYWYIIVGVIVIFIIALVSIVLVKNKKNNVV